ncbi:MAG: ATP-dependent helicase, partial [Actinobacteria bacterium]|nr:ATP-dependent helicase [Actinomycetota bacterium]
MDPRDLLADLDADQRQAVTTESRLVAVIAGAGSGKTRVLTRRIAYRIATDTADPRHTLALTFTREAAGELRRRLRQ